jgi:hypothetical protein
VERATLSKEYRRKVISLLHENVILQNIKMLKSEYGPGRKSVRAAVRNIPTSTAKSYRVDMDCVGCSKIKKEFFQFRFRVPWKRSLSLRFQKKTNQH